MVAKIVFILLIIYISNENLIPLIFRYFHTSRLFKSLLLIKVHYRLLFEAGATLRTHWWWIRLLCRAITPRLFIVWRWSMFPVYRMSENISLLMMMREGRCKLHFSGNSCRVHNLRCGGEAAHEVSALRHSQSSQVRQDHLAHAVNWHETDLVVLV